MECNTISVQCAALSGCQLLSKNLGGLLSMVALSAKMLRRLDCQSGLSQLWTFRPRSHFSY